MAESAKRGEIIPFDPSTMSGRDRNALPTVREGISHIAPKTLDHEVLTEEFKEQRKHYAPMHAHMEIVAHILATGGTFRLAAKQAGISVRQAKKYYQSADFRARIEELRSVMLSRARGKVMKELMRRLEKDNIGSIGLLDLLRVYDRVFGPVAGGKGGVTIAGDVNVTNYDRFLQALITPNARPEGEDFPIFELEGPAIPGESSPIDG